MEKTDPAAEATTVIKPRFRWFVRIGIALPVLFGLAVSISSLVLHGSLLGALLGISIFDLPPLALFGCVFWYPTVELRPDTLHLRRPIFPDAAVPYDKVQVVGEMAINADCKPVVWKLMSNGDRLEGVLREHGLLAEGEVRQEAARARLDRNALQISSVICCGAAGGMIAVGASLPSTLLTAAVAGVVAYRVIKSMGGDRAEEGGTGS